MGQIFLAGCCLAAALFQHGTTLSNPHTSAEDRAAGAKMFAGQCAGCHGKDGSGGTAADLTTGAYKYGSSDEKLFESIAKGVAGTAMPAFALDARQVWQLVTHVRSLSEGKAAEKAKGNADNGAKVFAAQGCVSCHAITGKGGSLGPDLTEVGLRRSLGHIERAIRKPDDEVSWDYWRLRARTKAGNEVRGLRLNEDTFSFQILEEGGRLRSIDKANLAEAEIVRSSTMPSFVGKLKGSEFDDLVAYLAGLRGMNR
jgi:cytochrome c oxidase cbb3-type subunit 3